MSSETSVKYQWQNPHLRKTIYPFREMKLRDFLLIYKEIDLWKVMKDKPVDSQAASELIQNHTDIEKQLAVSRLEKEQLKKGLLDLRKKHRQTLNRRDVRLLRYKVTNLETRLAGLESKKKTLERQIAWYEKFAPDHPYYEKWKIRLVEVMVPYEDVQEQLQETRQAYKTELAPFEAEALEINQRTDKNTREIKRLTEQKKKLPPLDKRGSMNQRSVVRWLVYKYEQELLQMHHDQLMVEVLTRFDEEPGRYPKWLQYMVIHFSGMRYRSAHGSWADPRDLLEMLLLDEKEMLLLDENKSRIQGAPDSQLAPMRRKAIAALEKNVSLETDARQKRRLGYRIKALKSSNWRTEVQKFEAEKVVDEVEKLTDQQVLDQLKGKRARFPDWAWKELVSRTDLRLEVSQDDWEELTREERTLPVGGRNTTGRLP
jgi:hypothetical protein